MITFTEHSSLKLNQRGIEKSVVIKAVRKPDYQFSSYGDRKIAYKKFGKLYLKVVYREEKEDTIVITQHWDKRFKP